MSHFVLDMRSSPGIAARPTDLAIDAWVSFGPENIERMSALGTIVMCASVGSGRSLSNDTKSGIPSADRTLSIGLRNMPSFTPGECASIRHSSVVPFALTMICVIRAVCFGGGSLGNFGMTS